MQARASSRCSIRHGNVDYGLSTSVGHGCAPDVLNVNYPLINFQCQAVPLCLIKGRPRCVIVLNDKRSVKV